MKYIFCYILGILTIVGAGTVYALSTAVTLHPGDTTTISCVSAAPTTSPPSPPPPTPVPPPITTGSISRSNVYVTGYADGDNTPPGSPVTFLNGITGVAKGDCTYNNPTTMAVGHVITNGNDVGDFAYGTKFYVPALQCYFSAQDTCGDGPSPQTQPCHSLKSADKGATLWLDAYVGPKGSATCEDAMTKLYSVVENPVAGLPVKTGNICNN